MPYPDQFYPVVDSVKWVARLTALGVGTIQLRAKDLNDSEALQIVSDALAVTKGTATKLVVNDYWRAAIVAGAQHLHLGQEDLVGADLNEIRKAGLTLGISTHDDEELATALRANPDYIALGPIFPTTLKSMRFAPQGIPKLAEWKKRIGNIPLVAIGGIKFEQSAEIFAAGADSIAVVSDVTQNADPDARVRQWLTSRKLHEMNSTPSTVIARSASDEAIHLSPGSLPAGLLRCARNDGKTLIAESQEDTP